MVPPQAEQPSTSGAACRLVARQMVGQWPALRLASRRWTFLCWRHIPDGTCGMGMFSFEILQRQFQLIRHLGDPLGRLAELHPP
jgi:hypothetical protein